ncbi:MAG: glycosyltransferase family A protein [Verrucomicrobiota bacterium]
MKTPTHRPLFSVVIPAYNAASFLPATVESVLAQKEESWELVIVNDGSSDDTLAVARELARRRPDRIRALNKPNGGVSSARNEGLQSTKGELIAFLDADDLWLEDHLTELHVGLGVAEIAVSGARVFRKDLDDSEQLFGMDDNQIIGFPESLGGFNFIIPSCVGVHRSVYEELGGFDETPEVQHAEDWDYWLRAIERRKRFHFTKKITVGYRKHATAATSSLENAHNAAVYCLRKNIINGHPLSRYLEETAASYLRRLGNACIRTNRLKALWYFSKSRELKPNSIPTILAMFSCKVRCHWLYRFAKGAGARLRSAFSF